MEEPKNLVKEVFFNAELHRRFRSLSKLNQELDGLTTRVPCVEIVHANQAEDHGAHRVRYGFTQDIHANLLVRDQGDIVSVVTTGRYTAAGEQQITVINKPHVMNPADRSTTTLREADGNLRVEATLNPPGLDISQGVVHAVLNAMRESKGHIQLRTHVGWHGALLRECHKLDHDDASFDAAVKNFRDYVYLVSNPKMVARLDMGLDKKNANFHKVITAQRKQFTLGTFERDDISPEMQQLRPNEEHSAFIKHFLLSFGDLSDSEADRRSKLPLYDMEGRKQFHKILRALVRGTERALRALKTLMAQLKRHGWAFSGSLAEAKGSIQQEEVEGRVKRAADEVDILQRFLDLFGKSNANKITSVLDYHLQWLSEVAEADGRLSETSITPLEDLQLDLSKKVPSATPGPSGATNEGTGDDQRNKAVDGDQSMIDVDGEQDTAGIDQDQVMADTTEQADEFDFLAERVVDTRSAKKGGWPAAALKWLQLLCLHEVGFLRATEFSNLKDKSARERVESEHILMSNIAVIEIHRSSWVDDRASFNEMLEELTQKDAETRFDLTELTKKFTKDTEIKAKDHWAKQRLNEDRIRDKQKQPALSNEELETRQLDHDNTVERTKSDHMESKLFSGTYHCEAIIMGALVILSQPGMSEDLTDEWLSCNGIFALKSDLLSMLRNPLPLLCVSKRCCPGCWIVFKKIARDNIFPKTESKVAMPGYHTKWYSHALPPFLPKDFVETAVQEAERQALEKLKLLQEEINREKAAQEALNKSSSEGPLSNPPSSAAPTPKRRKAAPMIDRSADEEIDDDDEL